MARSVKHQGFGRYVVLADGVQVAGPFTGPGAKDRASEAAQERPRPKSDFQRERDYWAKLYSDIGKPLDEEWAELKAVLLKRRDEREVTSLERLLKPILKNRRRARLARRQVVLPAPAQAT